MQHKKITPGDIAISPDISLAESDLYLAAYSQFTKDLTASRFNAMRSRVFACFQAVELWKIMEPVFEPLQFNDLWLVFDRKVIDAFDFQEHGQNVLTMKHPLFDSFITVDVAAYLFGFPYERMPVAIGGKSFVESAFTKAYSVRYPGIRVSVAAIQNP